MSFPSRLLLAAMVLLALGLVPAPTRLRPAQEPQSPIPGVVADEAQLDDVRTLQAAGSALASPSIAEWLGPLAPVALSPFFGITCLSGLALLSERGVIPENVLLARAGPLKRIPVFVAFLLLSLLTSLPRLTKVSKPLVQALDFLETWSAVVIVLVLKHLATPEPADGAVTVAMAGLLSTTTDGLLALLGAVNLLVIAGVRFVFEMLVWLSPIPAVDALFEGANKAVCAGLMAVYAFHPVAALVLNLIVFAGCLLVFGWAMRRLVFFQSVLLGPLLARLGWGPRSGGSTLTIFAKGAVGPFADKQRLSLSRGSGGLVVERRRLLRGREQHALTGEAVLDHGWIRHELLVGGDAFVVSRTWDRVLDERCRLLELRQVDRPAEPQPAAGELA